MPPAATIRARVAAVVDVALAAVDVTAMVFVMNRTASGHRRHLLAEARRHLALVLRGRRRKPGPGRGHRGRRHRHLPGHPASRKHCAAVCPALPLLHRPLAPGRPRPPPPTGRRARSGLPGPRPYQRTRTRPPAPGTGEWDIPRIPLLYDRAVIASCRPQRPAGCRALPHRPRPVHFDDVVVHQQAAMPEQLLLFAQEQPPPAARPAVDLATLRTDLEALELTADQIGRIGSAFATLGDEARRRCASLPAEPGGAPRYPARRAECTPPAPAAHRPGTRRARMMRTGEVSAHRRFAVSPWGFAVAAPGIRRIHHGAHRTDAHPLRTGRRAIRTRCA
ncbi:hypothetical protein O1M63_26850 [Streptomyces mirabilis]|nr:hypothetical protein [Streptomyces mirabilis]